MPYITSVERIGMQRGLLEDAREMVLEVLDERFGEVSGEIGDVVKRIEDRNFLKLLHRYAVRCLSLEDFEEALNGRRG